jgi:hypothetical protein
MNRFAPHLAWLLFAVLVPASSSAQVGNPFDHLKCYKIKDPTKAKYVADLVPLQQPPFQVEPGCAVLVPAKLFCIPVQKTNVQPPAPGAVNGLKAQDYLVYKIKCAKLPSHALAVNDQFAARTVTIGNHMFLMVPAFKQSHLCHNSAAPGLPPICGGDCTDPGAKCVLLPGTAICECDKPCGLDAAGTCGGTCPHDGQQCQVITLADGTLECTCDPIVDGCHLEDAATRTCGGPCPDPADECRLTTAGTCDCISKSCGPIGIRQCGGLCPTAAETCRVKPDDSGCECVPSGPTPCGLNTAGQCGGICPINLTCLPSGPAPSTSCACGIYIPPQ